MSANLRDARNRTVGVPGVIQDQIQREADRIVDERMMGDTLTRVMIRELALSCFREGVRCGIAIPEAFGERYRLKPAPVEPEDDRAIELDW